MKTRRGITILDVLVTLALLCVLAVIGGPRIVRARDAYAVRAARDAAVSLIERARGLAASRGVARVLADPTTGTMRLESPAGVEARAPLAAQAFGATLSVDGANTSVTLDFNALGLGTFANRTLRFRRGRKEAGLSLSTYGRVRRW